jgi:LacI family repressor for deo operon, udp, cdd, tsx, nupC, and nupG
MSKMTDVARLAGVSTATVSRVLAGGDKVANIKKEKVMKAIEQLNYKPNRLASNLRTLKSKTIVAVVRDISKSFFSDIIRGIEDVAYEQNYKVLLGDINNDPNRENDYIKLYNEKLVDGVILIGTRNTADALLKLTEGIPVVLASEFLDRIDLPKVSIDNIASSRQAADHLIGLGHKRIGFISGPMDIVICRDRMEGYRQGMLEHGLPVDEDLIHEGDWSIESGYEMAAKMLTLGQRPTAIFASNDDMAFGVIKCVKDQGLRVPQDVSVVGFDNISMASILEPSLTTVSQPRYEIGAKAMELLLQLIKGEQVTQRQYTLQSKLVIRESCGAPNVN